MSISRVSISRVSISRVSISRVFTIISLQALFVMIQAGENIEDTLTRFSPIIVSFDYDLNFGYLYNNYDSYVQTYNFSLSGYAKIQKCGDRISYLQLNMTGDCLSQYNSYEY